MANFSCDKLFLSSCQTFLSFLSLVKFMKIRSLIERYNILTKTQFFENFILHLTYTNVFEFQKSSKNIREIYVKYVKYMKCIM